MALLEYVRDRLCRELVGATVDPDNHFCELAAVIAAGLAAPSTIAAKKARQRGCAAAAGAHPAGGWKWLAVQLVVRLKVR